MKISTVIMVTVSATISALLLSCGTSLYRPAASKETNDALKEETLIQLNQGNYDSAAIYAEKLWNKDKSNESASLLSIALASQAGVGLFDLIVSTIEKTSGGTSSSSTSSTTASQSTGNGVFNSLTSVLPSFTTTQMSKLKQAIDVLDAAPDKKAGNLLFQRCLTAAIYTIPTLKNFQTSLTNVQTTLSGLPAKLGTPQGQTSCNASADTINNAATEFSNSLTELAALTTNFNTALSIIGDCFPSSQGKDSLNTVSQQISKLSTNADKGCSIPTNQKVGTYTLPSCLNDTVTATGGETAVANDGQIAGCELFINCTSGSCF
jgi:hypothetical protein